MKFFALLICNIILCCAVYGQTAGDEKEVRSVIQKMEDAWNEHDFSYSGKYNIFTPAAIVINPVGMYWRNRADIIKAHQALGNIRLKYESIKYDKVDVRFLVPAVALVTIQSTDLVNQDYSMPDGSKGRSKGESGNGVIGVTLVKKENNWKITSLQVTTVDANAAPFNPVK